MDIRATGCGDDASFEGGRYGWTRTDEDGNEKFHSGIDLLNDIGDPVKAVEGGTIWASEKATSGYVYYVIVITGEEKFHYYTHLKKGSQISENPPGEDSGTRSIDAGKIVGKTDTTGNASADPCNGGPPHLHFEVRTGATTWGEAEPVNPEKHLGTKFGDDGKPTSDSC
jgi:murein DD-endopeptidase MepM/ murein hydrolase activator NlpD